MYRTLKTLCALIPLLCLAGCSWQEYFVISNISPSTVVVQYEIADVEKGFPLFTDQPLLYQLNNEGEINWSTQHTPVDLDTSSTGLKLEIPSGELVVFGELNNDRYKGYQQEFINARVFNLKTLEVQRNSDTLKLSPASFDKAFRKTAGKIMLEIK